MLVDSAAAPSCAHPNHPHSTCLWPTTTYKLSPEELPPPRPWFCTLPLHPLQPSTRLAVVRREKQQARHQHCAHSTHLFLSSTGWRRPSDRPCPPSTSASGHRRLICRSPPAPAPLFSFSICFPSATRPTCHQTPPCHGFLLNHRGTIVPDRRLGGVRGDHVAADLVELGLGRIADLHLGFDGLENVRVCGAHGGKEFVLEGPHVVDGR